MNYWLLGTFVILFIVLIFVLPLKVRAMLHVNFINMEAYYLVHIWFFNLVCGKLFFNDEKLVVKNKQNRLSKSGETSDYDKELYFQLLKFSELVNVNVFKIYGNDDNAMKTSIVCGLEAIMIEIMKAFLIAKNKTLNAFTMVDPCFCDNQNQTSVYVVIKISIFDVIISMIKAKLKTAKKLKKKNEGAK